MSRAANLRLITCSIKSIFLPVHLYIPAVGLMATLVAACGPGLMGAQQAVNHAEEQAPMLQATNTPGDMTLSYRIHLKAAHAALEKHRYTKAAREANSAEQEANRILEGRKQLASDVLSRLDTLKKVLESQARPPQSLLDGYFDALDAFRQQEYEKAAKILAETETAAVRELHISQASGVIIQVNEWYFEEKNFVPVYSSIAENGEPGPVAFSLDHFVEATFLGSRLVARDAIFVHVYIEDKKFTGEGWVERRFVQ